MVNVKLANNSRTITFQELTICSLKHMLDWLEVNVPSLYYVLIVDLHIVLEHVYRQIDTHKYTLDFSQTIFNLKIPAPNHEISIQSFYNPLPKFFN